MICFNSALTEIVNSRYQQIHPNLLFEIISSSSVFTALLAYLLSLTAVSVPAVARNN